MKYFDENNQIIKAQQGLEFLRPKQEPIIDNAGGLGAGVAYKQMLIRQQQAKAEQKKRQEEQKEVRRPQAVLSQGRIPSQNSRQADLDRMRQEQRSQMISYDPNGTAHMQASVQMLPYVGQATKRYFSRPAGEIVGSELRTLNHALNPFIVSDDMFQAAKEQSRQGNPLSAIGLGFTGFGLGALAASPVKTATTAGVTATKRAAQGVKQATKTATENIGARMNAAAEGFNSYSPVPAYQPYIFTNGTVGLIPRNYNQMNFLGGLGQRVKGAWNGFKTKPTTAAESTTSEAVTASGIDNEILADIRYPGARNKRVKVFVPGETKTISTVNGKTIDPSTLTMETKPTVDGHIVEQVVPGYEVYAYEGKPVKSGVQQQRWFMYEGRYRPETDIKKSTVTTPETRVKPGDEIPEGAEFLNRKTGQSESLEGKVFRTPTGRGKGSYIYADGTPVEWYKNQGFYHRLGTYGTAAFLTIGAPNIFKVGKGVFKGTTSGDGAVPGVINEFKTVPINNDSIQRAQYINDSIQTAQKDSVDFNNQLQSSLEDLYRKADSLNKKQ